jgi:hypothetical protein
LLTAQSALKTAMNKCKKQIYMAVICCLFLLSACDEPAAVEPGADTLAGKYTVADDVLFLVLGKMSLYDQHEDGELSLRNHHFVAEIMPKQGRKIIGGTLRSENEGAEVLDFNPEGTAFLAHGARVSDPQQLHKIHPDGAYLFDYETESGHMSGQRIILKKRATIEDMPAAERVALTQNGNRVATNSVDPDADLLLAWGSMPGNTRLASSELEDLVFVLAFDCFGDNIAHSGRPYQGGRYLNYGDSEFVIGASSLKPGLQYTAIVEQATADVQTYQGVPAIATYATLTFIKFNTTGTAKAGKACPTRDTEP